MAVSALMIVAAACGGGGDPDTTTSSPPTTTATTAASTSTTVAPPQLLSREELPHLVADPPPTGLPFVSEVDLPVDDATEVDQAISVAVYEGDVAILVGDQIEPASLNTTPVHGHPATLSDASPYGSTVAWGMDSGLQVVVASHTLDATKLLAVAKQVQEQDDRAVLPGRRLIGGSTAREPRMFSCLPKSRVGHEVFYGPAAQPARTGGGLPAGVAVRVYAVDEPSDNELVRWCEEGIQSVTVRGRQAWASPTGDTVLWLEQPGALVVVDRHEVDVDLVAFSEGLAPG